MDTNISLYHAVEKLAAEHGRGYLGSEFDYRDAALVAERMVKLDAIAGPRVGDFVLFADDVLRRISYCWDDSVQTSAGGSFYLGDDFVSFSGSLHHGVPLSTLTRVEDDHLGDVWIFHHDFATAHNGVHTTVPFRLYRCTEVAPC